MCESPGRLLGIPQSPLRPVQSGPVHPPPALTSIRDDLTFFLLSSGTQPARAPGEGHNALSGGAPGIRGEKACLSIDVNGSQPRLELSGALPLPTPMALGWAGCCVSRHQVL